MTVFWLYFPQIIMLWGLIMYLVAAPDKPRVAEIARIMFFAGLLATCLNGIRHP